MAQGFKTEEPQRSFLSTVSSSEVSCTSATLEVEGPSAEPGGHHEEDPWNQLSPRI